MPMTAMESEERQTWIARREMILATVSLRSLAAVRCGTRQPASPVPTALDE